jgi:hypothetical protein
MRISKAIFVLVSGLSAAGIASAQDQAAVSAEKQTGIKTIIPGAYGNIEMRHTTLRVMDSDNKVVNDVPSLQARPTLGATFYDGAVDSAFTWVFRKRADTTVVERYYLMNVTQIKAIDGKYGNIGPYFETYQKNGQSFDESYIGLYGELNKDVELTAGKLSFNGYSQPVGLFNDGKTANSEDYQVSPRNETSQEKLALTDDDNGETIPQRDPSIFHFYGASAKFAPTVLKGFSVKGSIDLLHRYDPKYVTKETDDGEPRTELDGYAVSALTMNRVILGYKINDTLSLNNQIRHYMGGIYGSSIDSTHADKTKQVGNYRWENRLQLTATLF